MSDMESMTALPEDFDGRVRLFPLPELVVFPHAMQPLHIFEPRYCELLHEALAADELITMATLCQGSQGSAAGRPEIEPHVCITKIISHSETEENRHNVLLLGAQRARIRRELDINRPFRMAEVELIENIYPPSGAAERPALRERLLSAFETLIPSAGDVQANLHQLMSSQMTLGPITDILAYALQFDYRHKVRLLGEGDVDRRAERLVKVLERLSATSASDEGEPNFPPPFSLN